MQPVPRPMKALEWTVVVLLGAAVAIVAARGASARQAAGDDPADIVFLGGHIVTMDPARQAVEAVAVRSEAIAAAGSRAEVLALRGAATRVVELGDRALLPGFIDAHGHFLAVGRSLDALSLHPPPVGDVRNIDDLVRKIQAWIAEREIPAGGLVVGSGYDNSLLAEGRHPTRDDLDRASTAHRIVLTHVSGHLRTANSAALAAGGVTAETPDPPGGHIRRRAGSREPDGVLEERAGALVAASGLFAPTPDETEALARRAVGEYVRYGTTTVQDGSTGWETIDALRAAAEREPFAADVAAFPRFRTLADAERVVHEPDYRGGFRVAGVKFSLDGSPQGRTAWVTEPYAGRTAGGAARLPRLRHARPGRLPGGRRAPHPARGADHRPRQRRRGHRSDAGRRRRRRGGAWSRRLITAPSSSTPSSCARTSSTAPPPCGWFRPSSRPTLSSGATGIAAASARRAATTSARYAGR